MGFPYLRNPCFRNPCFRNPRLRNPWLRKSHLRNFSRIQAPLNHRRVPPCAVKTCAVRPVFARVVGELRAADPSNVHGPVKQNASPEAQSEALRRGWKPGQGQNPGPGKQDSQHMLEQPRGSFPEIRHPLDSPQIIGAISLIGPGSWRITFSPGLITLPFLNTKPPCRGLLTRSLRILI